MELTIKSSRSVIATDAAVSKIKELVETENAEGSFLRMGVKPGGCSGYSYEMFFDSSVEPDDIVESYGEVKIVIDEGSLKHIKGATLDYKDGLMDSGFSIDNPNAKSTCGCGESVS